MTSMDIKLMRQCQPVNLNRKKTKKVCGPCYTTEQQKEQVNVNVYKNRKQSIQVEMSPNIVSTCSLFFSFLRLVCNDAHIIQ